jgi:hypothetical protein
VKVIRPHVVVVRPYVKVVRPHVIVRPHVKVVRVQVKLMPAHVEVVRPSSPSRKRAGPAKQATPGKHARPAKHAVLAKHGARIRHLAKTGPEVVAVATPAVVDTEAEPLNPPREKKHRSEVRDAKPRAQATLAPRREPPPPPPPASAPAPAAAAQSPQGASGAALAIGVLLTLLTLFRPGLGSRMALPAALARSARLVSRLERPG